MQGYLLSRPLDAAQLVDLLDTLALSACSAP
jgi:EAL domain-containing protein (putative c-di-GMP-specific phosphodiesterase class I)